MTGPNGRRGVSVPGTADASAGRRSPRGPTRPAGVAAPTIGRLRAAVRRATGPSQEGAGRLALAKPVVSLLGVATFLTSAAVALLEAGTAGALVAAEIASLVAMWTAAFWTAHMVPPDRIPRLEVTAASIFAVLVGITLRTGFLAVASAAPGGWLPALVAVGQVTAADSLMLMGLLVAGGRALAVYPGVRRTALDQAWREVQVRRGRLASLTGQIRPHFAGNALNCVAGLLLTDVAAARVTLRRLRSVISRTSRFSDVHEIKLHEELALVRDYVAIEQARFKDRLTVHFDIQPEALDAYIPSLVLQPLVENAIVHGAMRRTGRADIHVRAELHEDELHLVVEDCGPGLPRRNLVRGVGASVTQDRLSSVHPGAARLTLGERLEGGARARVFLPYTTAPTLHRPATGEGDGGLTDAACAASEVRSLQLMPGAVAFWIMVAGLYAWQVAAHHEGGGSAPGMAGAVGALAAIGGGGLSLLAYHLGRTTPLERGQRLHGLLAVALLLAPPFILYWRAVLQNVWSAVPSNMLAVPYGTRLVALVLGIVHVLFAGYVVHQQAVVAAKASLIRRQHLELAEAERRQRSLTLSDAEMAASFDAIDAVLDRDPEAARRYMADLMARLRRSAENRV
jgi:two-component system, LytTR family, sensor kinase